MQLRTPKTLILKTTMPTSKVSLKRQKKASTTTEWLSFKRSQSQKGHLLNSLLDYFTKAVNILKTPPQHLSRRLTLKELEAQLHILDDIASQPSATLRKKTMTDKPRELKKSVRSKRQGLDSQKPILTTSKSFLKHSPTTKSAR